MSIGKHIQKFPAWENAHITSAPTPADVVLVKVSPETITQGEWYRIPLLGLGYIAAYLRSHGVSVAIVDAMFDRLGREETIQKVVEMKPRMACFTAMTHEIYLAAETAAAIRRKLPGVCNVIGGPHCTALPKQTLQELPAFDFGVFGEGEEVVLELYRALYDQTAGACHSVHSALFESKGSTLVEEDARTLATDTYRPLNEYTTAEETPSNTDMFSEINGLVWRCGPDVVQNSPRTWIEDLDCLPFPAWDLYEPSSVYRIYGSRGCPFRCIFCMRVLGEQVRFRSPKNVVDEFEWVVEHYHPDEIDFSDETFTLRRRWVLEICEELISRGLHRKTSWSANARVNIVDEQLLRRMRQAGCVRVGFGIESGNEQILKVAQKSTTLKQIKEAVSACKRVGLDVAAYYILGFPNETYETALDTIRLAARLNTTSAAFGIMVPYPGTKVAEMAMQGEGGYRLIADNWSDFDKHLGNALELETLPRRQLERLQAKAYLWFYLRNFRVRDLIVFLWSKRKAVWKMVRKVIRL